MSVVRLLNLTPDVVRRSEDPEAFEMAHGASLGDDAQIVHDIARANESFRACRGSRPEWGGYLAIDPQEKRVVGSCAFKGDPMDGTVEIAFFTFPSYEGRGFATAMVAALLVLCKKSAAVRRVIAHTEPEENPSNTVLIKNGFTKVGEIMDPEDGRVWKWHFEK